MTTYFIIIIVELQIKCFSDTIDYNFSRSHTVGRVCELRPLLTKGLLCDHHSTLARNSPIQTPGANVTDTDVLG